MNTKTISAALCLVLCFILSAPAQKRPKLNGISETGFSSERTVRITTFFHSEVERGAIPGAVIVVSRHGKVVYREAVGYQDREKKTAMKADAIFRIYSMTKPITTVAVMMLAEEGKIDVMAPVARYLPEFKGVTVGVERTDSSVTASVWSGRPPSTGKPALALEAPVRPMTVQDLLRHTSGLVYGPFGNSLVHQEYNKANLSDNSQTLTEFITKISQMPLAHQPGSTWEYGMSTDVLGRIVEVVSSLTLDRFIEERITKPLGMHDTAFYLNASQAERLAEPQIDQATGKRPALDHVEDLTKEKVKWFSGGGGMLSTASDYVRFCQMLVNGGELDGVRLLSPKTLAVMTSDQLPPNATRVGMLEVMQDLSPIQELGQSFGLGFAVRTNPGHSAVSGSVGDYFWAGSAGTYFWIDPQEELCVVMMMQIPLVQAGPYRRALREMVYGALVH